MKKFSDRNNAWLQIIQGLRAIVSEPEKQTSPKVGPDRTVTDIPAGSAKDATAQPSPASNLLSFRTAPSDVESPTINRLLFFNTHNADVTPEAANVVKLAAREILERDCKRVTVSGPLRSKRRPRLRFPVCAFAMSSRCLNLLVCHEILSKSRGSATDTQINLGVPS